MRLATDSLGVPSARPSASAVAPPPSDEHVASPLHREKAARPSASAAVAPPPSDDPVASPLQRAISTARPSASAAVAPPPSVDPVASPLHQERSTARPSDHPRPSASAVAPLGSGSRSTESHTSSADIFALSKRAAQMLQDSAKMMEDAQTEFEASKKRIARVKEDARLEMVGIENRASFVERIAKEQEELRTKLVQGHLDSLPTKETVREWANVATNESPDDEKLEVKTEISATNTPEDFTTGGKSIGKPSDDDELEYQAGISVEITNKTSHDEGGTINKTSDDKDDRKNDDARPSNLSSRNDINEIRAEHDAEIAAIDAEIAATEARSRELEKAWMAQSREIEATTPPEDSNTGGETNKPSDDEGDVFRIFTAPRNPAGTVAAALTQNAHHHSTISDPDEMEHDRGPSGQPTFPPLVDMKIGDVAAGENTTKTTGGDFSIVRISERINNVFQQDGVAMAPPTTVDATITAAKTEYYAAKMENASAKLQMDRAQLLLEQAKGRFALSEVLISEAAHELLSILSPNDTKPSSEMATTPATYLSWADIDEASVVSDEPLVDITSTLDDADSPVVPSSTNIFKGPRNLGELSPSATSTTIPSQRRSTPSLNTTSSSPLALPTKPVSSVPSRTSRLKTSHPFRDRGLQLQHRNQRRGRQHQSCNVDHPSPAKRRRRRRRNQNSYQETHSSIATRDSTVPKCTRRQNRRFMAPTQDGRSEKAARARFFESPPHIPRHNNNLAL